MHAHPRTTRAVLLLVLSAVAACAGARTVTVHHADDNGSSTGGHVGGLRNGPWTDRYANGRTQSEGSYENDVQTGPWTYWFENGNKEMQGRFANERRDSEWTSWYESGALRAQGRFERGFEEGSWRFYAGSGALDHEGYFELGQPVLRWTYFHPDGSVRATGNYLAGVKVGEWITRDAAGNKTEISYPMPAGFELAEETFSDSTEKRTGFLHDGVPAGRWITDHPGGKPRLECSFSNGEPNGRAHAWKEDGTMLAEGMLKNGCIIGEWIFMRGPMQEKIEFAEARPRQTFAGDWSPANAPDQSGTMVVETWVAELCSPRQPAPIRSVSVPTNSAATSSSATSSAAASTTAATTGATTATTTIKETGATTTQATTGTKTAGATTATTDTTGTTGATGVTGVTTPRSATIGAPASTIAASDGSGIPARAQPWTEYETSALPALVNLYGVGKTSGARDEEDWKSPVLRKRRSTPDASATAASDSISALGLIGRPLPVRRFTTADGGVIDLDEFVGKKNVLVTILRGFGGQVCVYCTAQTKGLADFAAEFAALDTEILVVYPGPASGLDAFLEAYRRTFGPDEKLPYKLLYDKDLALTRALHIEDNIAMPTSIVLDRKGIIRWCRVAKDYADRPSAKEVLGEITAMTKTKR